MNAIVSQEEWARRAAPPHDGTAFADSAAHLMAELERVDLLIRAEVAGQRKLQAADDQFRGLYISEEEIDGLLERPLGSPSWPRRDDDTVRRRDEALDALEDALERRKRASLDAGVPLRLHRLETAFGLDRVDLDALLICLAIELDLRYERIYSYLQDDVTRKKPSVDLVINLLSRRVGIAGLHRERLAASGTLVRAQLIEVHDDPSQPRAPWLAKSLKVSDRIVDFLLGSDTVDERLREIVRPGAASPGLGDLSLDYATRRGLEGLVARTRRHERNALYLRGPAGAGKRTVAEAVCHDAGRMLLVVDTIAALSAADGTFAAELALIEREVRLTNGALYWRHADRLLAEAHEASWHSFLAHCRRCELVFLGGETPWRLAEGLDDRDFAIVDLRRPSAAEQDGIWVAALEAEGLRDAAIDRAGLSGKFRFTHGEIHRVVSTATSLARWRDGDPSKVVTADLYEACRLHSNQRLGSLARKAGTQGRWNDIVLPDDRLALLREICNQVRFRDLVFGTWGFDDKLEMGKGLAALFAGPSGTGKTMAAGIIAGELGLDLYKIDLSAVVSKYIGETEKNLSRIFSEAETSNAILFFDEADALFGKRSEVRDSHDRYANIEVGYLLQRIEEYEGITLLSTNFRRNMDEAFVRRLQFTIDFPLPCEEDRYRIWTAIWPSALPLDPGIDLRFMARNFEMTGGNIRNVAVAAAFLAASDGGPVGMTHLIDATQREYQKMGKLISEGQFAVAKAS
ncbi:MAG: ATP-binding protein [Burkholderiaceae bacterium]